MMYLCCPDNQANVPPEVWNGAVAYVERYVQEEMGNGSYSSFVMIRGLTAALEFINAAHTATGCPFIAQKRVNDGKTTAPTWESAVTK